MKIQNPTAQAKHAADTHKTTKANADKGPLSAKGSATPLEGMGDTTKVNLSDRAQAMQKARDIAGDQSIDEAKVARLQKLIDDGKYSVDARAVADRLVDEHLMMPE